MRRSADERILRRTALRIGLQTAAGVALTVVVLAVVAVLVVLHNQRTAEDSLMSAAIARADDVGDPPVGVWLVIQRDGRTTVSPGLPPGLPDTRQLSAVAADRTPRTTNYVAYNREFRIDTRPMAGGGVIQAALDLSTDHVERYRLMEALLASGAIGLVIAVAVGVWLARRAVSPLATALAQQRRFVADAGHELRTPLTLLSTRAQLIRHSLRDEADPATLRSDVDGLVRDAHHLTDILNDLLIAADPRETTEAVELSDVIGDAVDSARPLADESGVTLTTIVAPLSVQGGRASLRRAVTALLDNAIRHANHEVTLRISAAGGQAVIDVADDGPGLDPAVVPGLFARFATTPADGRSGANRRYGLGLALVSEIAARHGGSIAVLDTDRGATFRLTLPVTANTRPDAGSERASSGHPPTRQR